MSAVRNGISLDRRSGRVGSGPGDSTSIGQLLVVSGRMTESDVRRVIFDQRQNGQRFGDTAIRLGLLSQQDLQGVLSQQFEYPYLKSDNSGLDSALIAAYQPFSVQSEALRALRTQLMLRWFRDRSRTLAIVAPRSGSGSSLLAANLAIVFSQLGERTLLIDANFRAPSQQSLFGLQLDGGLSNVLAGRGSFKESPVPIAPFDNLWVLCAGATPPNPQELLGRVAFSYVIEAAPAMFDVVIVDAPPVLEYADAQTIAMRAGGCLMVARQHVTKVIDIQRAKAQLAPTGAALLGAVMCA